MSPPKRNAPSFEEPWKKGTARSGEGGIRTPDAGFTDITVFETAAFNRSATSPRQSITPIPHSLQEMFPLPIVAPGLEPRPAGDGLRERRGAPRRRPVLPDVSSVGTRSRSDTLAQASPMIRSTPRASVKTARSSLARAPWKRRRDVSDGRLAAGPGSGSHEIIAGGTRTKGETMFLRTPGVIGPWPW